MRRYTALIQKNVNKFFYRINYKQGLDKEFDDVCEKEFLKFLDVVYYLIAGCYVFLALTTAYFFISDVLIK